MTTPRLPPDPNAAEGAAAALSSWFAAARVDLASRTPPGWLQSELQAKLAEREALRGMRVAHAAPGSAPARPAWRWLAWFAVPVAAACALLLATTLALQAPSPDGWSGDAPRNTQGGAPFIALASMDAIAAEPDKVVVPAELPRAALSHYGLPFDPARADQPARAELLLSAGGAVLAVRFLQ